MTPTTDTALNFPHRRAGHCGSGALRDLLEFHGRDYGHGPLGEGMVFGLGGGLGFLYLQLEGMDPPIYLVGRTGDLERDIADHLDLPLKVTETDDPAEGWRRVREAVDDGRPPMVWADIRLLEYLRVKMHNTRHDIVVVGYDDTKQIAWVADNDRDDLQRCSMASLAAARNSSAFPGPNRHTMFDYDFSGPLRPAADAVARALARAIGNMRGGGAALAGMSGDAGLAGIERFAESYPTWPEVFGKRLDGALGALSVLIVKAGTGGAMFRSLHADFLAEAAGLLDDRRLAAAAGVYEELAGAWRELADTAKVRDHAAGRQVVERIRRLEHDGVAAMEACA